MTRYNTLGRVATMVGTDGNGTYVRYHNTDVVRFNVCEVQLRHGGYKTATTKVRMNQASQQFGLGFMVFQKNKQWFVKCGPVTLPWEDTDEVFRFQRV